MPGLDRNRRESFLQNFTGDEKIISRLIDYLTPGFSHPGTAAPLFIPPDDQPAAAYWRQWLDKPASDALGLTCPELAFPLQKDISKTDGYRAAVFRGETPPDNAASVFKNLNDPGGISLQLQQTGAGRLPVFIFENYQDFLSVFTALSQKNEPRDIPPSMGAALLTGYNNWNRFHLAAEEYAAANTANTLFGRGNIFTQIKNDPSKYRDSIVLLSRQPYSNTPASRFALSKEGWLERSLQIRSAHEAVHYISHRILGGAFTHLHDELIADYTAFSEAFGYFSAEAFLDMMGCGRQVENGGERYRLYTAELEETEAEDVLIKLLRRAAHNLERFESPLYEKQDKLCRRVVSVLVLSAIPLDSLASDQGEYLIRQQCNLYRDLVQCRE